METTAILLAAGESERMGAPKALLRWRGRPLVSHQIRQIVKSRVSECVVVLGEDAERLEPYLRTPMHPAWKVRSVTNPCPASGKTSSILAGLTTLTSRPDGILVVSVDQPVDHQLLDALLATAETEWERNEPAGCRPIVIPAFQGRRGHPPIFSGALVGELMGITEESEGLKAVVRRRRERVLEMPWSNSDVLLNLNTPLDLPTPGPRQTIPRH